MSRLAEGPGRSGELLSERSFAVRQAYEDAGFDVNPGPEPPDFLVTELESAGQLRADGGKSELLGAFLNDHLGKWAPVWRKPSKGRLGARSIGLQQDC